ncbi:MAG: hypothetical protein AB1815_05945 [Bacillota bacterium]
MVLKSLVADECANHSRECNGIQNHCCTRKDNLCVFSHGDAPRCKYFEDCVLPLNKKLEAVYLAEAKAATGGYSLTKLQRKLVIEDVAWAGKSQVDCARCGKPFPAKSSRRQHCDKCKPLVSREQARARKKH